MGIKILAVGRKHESWVEAGIRRYEERLRKPLDVKWQLLQHSNREPERAKQEESARIMAALKPEDTVVLLDERGENMTSEQLATKLSGFIDVRASVVLIIGGSFGVDDSVRKRANLLWSLSRLVFPHQLVRLIVTEQIYRAQEIRAGKPYHHA